MKISDIMTPNPYVLKENQSLREAAALFTDKRIDGAPVVDDQNRIVGLFTKSHIYKAIAGQSDINLPVSAMMTRDVTVLNPDDEVDKVFNISLSRLPVAADGKVVGMITKSDIMHGYNMQINDLTNKLNTVIDSVYNAIVSIDIDSRIVLFNDAAERVFGWEREKVLGKPYKDVFPQGILAGVLRTGETVTSQKIQYKDKTLVSNMSPIIVDQKIIGAVSVSQDISELEQISEELKYTKNLKDELDAIFEASFDYIFVTDEKAKVLRVNPAYTRITGIDPNEIIGKTMYDLVKQGYYDRSTTIQVIETGKPVTFTQKIIRTGRTVLITGTPVFNEKGELFRVITNGRDITELNQLREEVEQAQVLSEHYKKELIKIRGVDEWIIKSPKMKHLMELVLHVAKVESAVLITGESGVGKEVVAHQLYINSNRKDKQYIRVNCAAIPENLLESELFGYEPGAFTGANKGGKMGIFELANGGTLLLDEIGELPLGLQAKLLRVIQESEVTRIGGGNPIKINVRLIASTNRDLREMVNQNLFRKDLFYRLNVVPIHVPPLRERKEEIPDLVDYFTNVFNQKYNLNKQIDHRLIDSLMQYDWPGNIRELKNVIERAIVTSSDTVIREIKWEDDNQAGEQRFSVDSQVSLRQIVEDLEKDIITKHLKKHGSTRKAAAALGLSQTTLCRKAAQYGIKLNGNMTEPIMNHPNRI